MKIRRTLKRISIAVGVLILILLTGTLGLRLRIHNLYHPKVVANVEQLPREIDAPPRVAIVFGAGLWSGGETPSPVLHDRITTAVELYRTGRVRKLLLTGDNRFLSYNEPAVMRRTALEMGVPSEDLVLDYAGRRTYDSCYRAREIYDVKRAVLVTQDFHLDRALYLCESLGIDSIGVAADRQSYGDARNLWNVREILATVGAWSDINLTHPVPILGEKTPIN